MLIEDGECLLALEIPVDDGVVEGGSENESPVGREGHVPDEAPMPAHLGLDRRSPKAERDRGQQRHKAEQAVAAPFLPCKSSGSVSLCRGSRTLDATLLCLG